MAQKPPIPPERVASPRFKGKKIGNSQKQQTLAALIRELPNPAEIKQIADEIAHVHDRTAALLIATQLEAFLERAIYKELPSLNQGLVKAMTGRDGPLNGFRSKILLAMALGLIDDRTGESLDTIREIRNAFAHAPKPLRFATPQIATLCARLGRLHGITPRQPSSSKERLAFQLAGISEDPNRQILLGSYAVLIPLVLELILPGLQHRLVVGTGQHGKEDSSGGIAQ